MGETQYGRPPGNAVGQRRISWKSMQWKPHYLTAYIKFYSVFYIFPSIWIKFITDADNKKKYTEWKRVSWKATKWKP